MSEWNLNFMHPQYGTMFPATIDGDFTVKEMLANLLDCGFLPPYADGYALVYGGLSLAPDTLFDQIPDIYDGCIIKVLRLEAGATAVPTAMDTLVLHVLHPNKGWTTKVEVAAGEKAQKLLEDLHERGFFVGDMPNFVFAHKQTALDMQQTFQQLGLQTNDYIEIINIENTKNLSPEQILANAAAEYAAKQESIEKKIEGILHKIPQPNSLPISTTLAINPNKIAYESFDSLVRNIRQMDNLPPVTRIEPKSIIPYILVAAVMVLAILTGIFWHKIIALF